MPPKGWRKPLGTEEEERRKKEERTAKKSASTAQRRAQKRAQQVEQDRGIASSSALLPHPVAISSASSTIQPNPSTNPPVFSETAAVGSQILERPRHSSVQARPLLSAPRPLPPSLQAAPRRTTRDPPQPVALTIEELDVDDVVAAVDQFARADAANYALRDNDPQRVLYEPTTRAISTSDQPRLATRQPLLRPLLPRGDSIQPLHSSSSVPSLAAPLALRGRVRRPSPIADRPTSPVAAQSPPAPAPTLATPPQPVSQESVAPASPPLASWSPTPPPPPIPRRGHPTHPPILPESVPLPASRDETIEPRAPVRHRRAIARESTPKSISIDSISRPGSRGSIPSPGSQRSLPKSGSRDSIPSSDSRDSSPRSPTRSETLQPQRQASRTERNPRERSPSPASTEASLPPRPTPQRSRPPARESRHDDSDVTLGSPRSQSATGRSIRSDSSSTSGSDATVDSDEELDNPPVMSTPHSRSVLYQAFAVDGCSCNYAQGEDVAPEGEQPTPPKVTIAEFVAEGTTAAFVRSQFHQLPDVLAHVAEHGKLPTYTYEQLRGVDWRRLLAAQVDGAHASVLSLEQSCLTYTNQPFHIIRCWDIDALLLPLKSLAVHRAGIRLFYTPRLTKTISHDWYIPVGRSSIRPQRCKHIRIATGLDASGFDTYLFFPDLPIPTTKRDRKNDRQRRCYMNKHEQAHFVDTILIPALRETYPSRMLAHHPLSFQQAYDRAHARQKQGAEGNNRNVSELAYDIVDPSPANQDPTVDAAGPRLHRLWQGIERRLRRDPDECWHRAELVAVQYGTKIRLEAQTPLELKELLDASLERWFDPLYRDVDRAWFDLAYEDIPIRPAVEDAAASPLIALRRTACSVATTSDLNIEHPQVFQWFGTQEACSVRGKTLRKSAEQLGGIGFYQGYNISKDLFASVDRAAEPIFSQPTLPLLAFSQSTIDQVAAVTSLIARDTSFRRARVLDAFKAEITQANNTLASYASSTVPFGVRGEFRTCWDLLCQPDLPGTRPSLTEGLDGRRTHWPFLVFESSDVVDFMRLQLNRWLFAICAVLSQRSVNAGVNVAHLDRTSRAVEEASASAMLAVLFDMLTTTCNSGSFSFKHRLSRDRYDRKGESDGEQEGSRRGLNIMASLRTTHAAWLPVDLFDWVQLRFHTAALQQTAYSNDFLRRQLRTTGSGRLEQAFHQYVKETIDELVAAYQALRAAPDPDEEDDSQESDDWWEDVRVSVESAGILKRALQRLSWACGCRYASYMLRILSKPDKRLGNEVRLRCFFSQEVTDEERAGLCGLSYDLVHRMTGGRPNIVIARNRGGNAAEGGFISFTPIWQTRLQLLFDWDDGFLRDSWEHRPWRRWVRYCYDALDSLNQQHPDGDWPADIAQRFKHGIGRYVMNWIRILPAYDKSKIHQAVRQKKAPGVVAHYQVKWVAAVPMGVSGHIQPGTIPKYWSLVSNQKRKNELHTTYRNTPNLLCNQGQWTISEDLSNCFMAIRQIPRPTGPDGSDADSVDDDIE